MPERPTIESKTPNISEKSEQIKPTIEIEPFPGVKMIVYGKPYDFSFIKNEQIENSIILDVFKSLNKSGINKIFAPYPMKPEIIDEAEDEEKKYSNFPEEISGIKVLRGTAADADAVVLNNPGEAHVFAPADCMTGIIQYEVAGKKKIISAHIGLGSLFPKNVEESLIKKIRDKIKRDNGQNPQVYLDFAIPPELYVRDLQFDGRQAENNYYLAQIKSLGIDPKLTENRYFQIDLKNIAAELFKISGLDNVKIGENTTANSNIFWSNFNHEGADKSKRNLVVVSFT